MGADNSNTGSKWINVQIRKITRKDEFFIPGNGNSRNSRISHPFGENILTRPVENFQIRNFIVIFAKRKKCINWKI